MTLKELAQLLGITPDALRMQIHRGAIAATKVGEGAHGVWLITEDEAKRYAEEQAGKRGYASPRHTGRHGRKPSPGTGGRPRRTPPRETQQ